MKKVLLIILSEFAKNGFGWFIGILAAKLISQYFAVSSWQNGWGLFTSKSTVSSATFGVIEFLAEGVVGFLAFVLVNRLVRKFGNGRTVDL